MSNVKTWENIWSQTEEEQLKNWEEMGNLIFPSIEKEIGEIGNKYILEAGCGTGLVSLWLAQKNGKIFLLDNSKPALYVNKKIQQKIKTNATSICASILKIPLKKDSFDIVWNGGVLEHFSSTEQEKIIAEMSRVCKLGGKLIILVPYAHAFLYRIGKYFAEKHKLWEYGYEKPFISLKSLLTKNGLIVLKEYNIAYETTIGYITYLPINSFLKKLLTKILLKAKTLLKHVLNGYLIITIAEKV